MAVCCALTLMKALSCNDCRLTRASPGKTLGYGLLDQTTLALCCRSSLGLIVCGATLDDRCKRRRCQVIPSRKVSFMFSRYYVSEPGPRVIHKCYVLLDMIAESYWGTNPWQHFTAGVPGTPVTRNPSKDYHASHNHECITKNLRILLSCRPRPQSYTLILCVSGHST